MTADRAEPDVYDLERVEGMKTLGDAYRHCRRDQDAFVAGAHYALDKMLNSLADLDGQLRRDYNAARAADILRRAKAGEPQ